MTDRDPPRATYFHSPNFVPVHPLAYPVHGNGFGYTPAPVQMSHRMNPAVDQFQPSNSQSYHLERKVNDLEREQGALRTDVTGLQKLCDRLHVSLDTLEKGGWDVKVGPFQDANAEQIRKELDTVSAKANGHDSSNTFSSVPPHLRGRGANEKSAPHMRNGVANGPTKDSVTASLVTDGVIEPSSQTTQSHGNQFTPPVSPKSMRPREDPVLSMRDGPLDPTTTKPWVPHFLTTLSSLKQEIVAKIPLNPTMTTFSPDFLRNTFGGSEHSPGFNFIPPSPGPCILRNRSYFTIDGRYDPYIPVQPGLHGAKLVPFFNENPEAVHVLPVNFDSTSDNVPLFVMHVDAKGRWRYTYYGHYSQTRWSDKLDYDRMVQCIPTELREYWAKELSSAGRPEWVSNALMNHFFPKPEYAGRMFGKSVDEGGSVMSADMDQREEKVRKDVVKYLGELRDWEKDARMKTAMINKDFILHAFERADADDPPALRLWWEYLECVDWKKDFYDMLCTLQARDPTYERY